MTWNGAEPPSLRRATPVEATFGALRSIGIIAATAGCASTYLLFRAAGAGPRSRGRVVWLWARIAVSITGVKLERRGRPVDRGALVANHVSWMDILTMCAAAHVTFVSKAEVRGWPVIGWLARMVDTMFIERRSTEAKRQQAELERRVHRGDLLCFFPEGTSTDGLRVLPFKSSLFAVFMTETLREEMEVQPVTLTYLAPPGQPAEFFGWWGDMALGPSIWSVLTMARGARVVVTFHEPHRAREFENRKHLASSAQVAVHKGLRDAAPHIIREE